MQDLINQERLEMEVLDRLNSGRFLDSVVFCGGTMLRLCHGLDRFSVDLDFWLPGQKAAKNLLDRMQAYLSGFYSIKDAAEKFYTLVIEVKSPSYRRSLKIEIRKDTRLLETVSAIAYSTSSNRQVLLRTASLREMAGMKTAALLDREEIRDAYDLEFLIRKGVPLTTDKAIAMEMLARIAAFSKVDYKVKLGSLLEPKKRAFYNERNFELLKSILIEKTKD